MTGGRTAYAQSGVDMRAGDRAVELMRARLRVSEHDLLGGIGGFGAVLALPEGFRQPVLVTAADGVGTKTDIARRLGRLDTIGQDLVAMCADDVVCHGARPTFFLDYLAVGKLEPVRVAGIVGGIAAACDEIGCALVGGETAEHPGLMDDDAFDLAGFCIGLVERDELVDRSDARAGDVVIGMASSGLHANGFSLVRRLLGEGLLDLRDDLLAPTRLYTAAVLDLIHELRLRGLRLSGLAHVTGGGVAGNLPRALPKALGIRVQTDSWPQPELFATIGRLAGMDGRELRTTLNCGIGMGAVVEPAASTVTLDILARAGIDAWPIGVVAPASELGGRYLEA